MESKLIARKGVLVLEQKAGGELLEFPGELFGAFYSAEDIASKSQDKGYGEVCFNTSITGYQEILTDPSYYGQIVCMTAAHIGNTGVNSEDEESLHPWCGGFIVNDLCTHASNYRSEGELHTYLETYGIPGLQKVDTRLLTRILRSKGAVRGIILPWEDRAKGQMLLKELPPFEGRDLIKEVTTSRPYFWGKENNNLGKKKVVALDFGIKRGLLRLLEEAGCSVEVLPANAASSQILDRRPDGVFLSNGPGDPAMATYAVRTVREILGKVPIFGVCMGHQILSLAAGGQTYKLKFGHRGGNQPVIDHETTKVEISSHNHGYAVDAKSLPPEVKVTHINLNDQSVEGISIPSQRAFSVQYHPEACPGPHDSKALFDRFVKMMN